MKSIHVLDSDTINKIAAGEVVERPSSVVKELVENAIDAKASAVTVEIREGGIAFIRVTDNGSGIDRDDIETAFLRHATSKIETAMDLITVGSLGFRGEALSSIASVAQVELITKVHRELLGVRYCADGGVCKSCEDIGCPDGTTIIVRNLFYNTPARRKFLKTPATEAGYISDLMGRLALSHPDISFKFIHNGQNKLHTSGNGNLRDIIYQIYGRDVTGQLLKVEADTGICQVSGHIGKPILSRGNRSWENYFINGRYIKSNIITKAIEDAYKTFVMIHKYPFTVLHITIDPAFVDVNVHPRKMEIRFNQNEAVYRQIYDLVRAVLEQRELIPAVTLDKGREKKEKEKETRTAAPEPFELQRLAAMGERKGHEVVRDSGAPYGGQSSSGASYSGKSYNGSPNSGKSYGGTPNSGPSYGHGHGPGKEDRQEQREPQERKPQEKELLKPQDGMGVLQPQTGMGVLQPPEEYGIPISKPLVESGIPTLKHQAESGSVLEPENTVGETVKPESETGGTINTDPTELRDVQQMMLFGEDERLLDERARARHRLIGQVFDTYWMVEYDGKLFIIDQHAAHEKVLYERLMADFSKKALSKQMLSPPVILTLSMQEENIYKLCADYFAELGFEIELFGGREYAIRGVPLQLFGMNARDIFVEILDSLSDESRRLDGTAMTDRIATMACKAAVKGNNKLSFEEADALIDQLLQAKNPYTCPHGRPTIISLSKYELEKKFKRVQ